MGKDNVISLIIEVKDMGSVAINQGRKAIDAYRAEVDRFNGSVQGAYSSILKLGGAYVSLDMLRRGFMEGIQAVDDFNTATIGIAATLTDMAKKGSEDLKQVYSQNLAYAKETYEKVELAAAKFFASGKEMIEGWQILVQKGVVLTSDEDINNLGILVDKVKLLTQGQSSSLQIAQELRSAMNGQSIAGSQLANLLEARLGKEWEKQLNKAREQGRVLQFLASQFQGVGAASEDIGKTLESQKSTLSTLLQQVGRNGLSQAYDDIVRWLAQGNEYLRTHKDLLASDINRLWGDVRTKIESVAGFLQDIREWSSNNPFLSGVASDVATLAISIAAGSKAAGLLWNMLKGVWGVLAGISAFASTLFAPLASSFSGLVTSAVAVSGAWAAMTAAAVALGTAIAGWSLWDIIQEWDVAGLKIKEWCVVAETYLSDFWIGLKRMFTVDFPDMIGKAWDKALEKAKTTLASMIEGLKSFMSGEWMTDQMPGPVGFRDGQTGSTGSIVRKPIPFTDEERLRINQQVRDAYENLRKQRLADAQGGSGPTGQNTSGNQPYETQQFSDEEAKQKEIEASLKRQIDLKKAELELERALAKQREVQLSTALQLSKADSSHLKAAEYWAAYYGIPDELFKAVIASESGWNPNATSGKGAIGLAQLMPGTARDLGVTNPYDPYQSLMGGARYLRGMFDRFQSWPMAVTAYNMGPGAASSRGAPGGPLLDLVNRKLFGLGTSQGGLDREKQLLQEIMDLELQAAKSEEERGAIRMRHQAQMAGMAAEQERTETQTAEASLKAWEDVEKEGERLAAERQQWARERLDAEVSALRDILANEQLTADDRKAIWDKYLADRKQQIEAEADEMRKKGVAASVVDTWEDISMKGIRDEVGKTKDAFGDLKQAIDGWGKQSAGAIADFVTGAKASFSDLAQSILKDILQMLAYESITKPLFGALSGGLGEGGWLRSILGAFTGSKAHSGWVVGAAPAPMTVALNPLLFAGAPRLHSGLAPDEFPAILQGGEEVVSRSDRATILSELRQSKRAAPNVTIKIENQTWQPIQVEQKGAQFDAEGYIVSVVAKNYERGGNIWKIIRGSR